MVEALQSGLPTSFTYVVEIFRDRPNWFDDGIARARIEVICTFNSVTREYLLNYRRDRPPGPLRDLHRPRRAGAQHDHRRRAGPLRHRPAASRTS